MFRARLLTFLAVLSFLPIAPAQDVGNMEQLVNSGRDLAIRAQSTGDAGLSKNSKKALEQAEKQLKKSLRGNPACERCSELLAGVYYYQSIFGFERSLDECFRVTTEGLARFPGSAVLAMFKGYAHYGAYQYREAIGALQRSLASTRLDAQTQGMVRAALDDSRNKFLGTWNRHANFYQSNESRLTAWNPQANRMEVTFQASQDWERNLGGLGFAALTANAPQLQDPEIQQYCEDLVSGLVSRNPGSPFDYKVTLLNTREVNAVTPPGYVVVHRGLLEFADSEGELAGVLAHELGHNYAHHAARAAIKSMIAQGLAKSVIGALNPQSQAAQMAANLGSQFALNLFVLAYSRFEEKEADLYGAHIMFNAGYNPTAASDFFLKMYKQGGKGAVKFLSTHPPNADRATYLTDYLDAFPLDREMKMDSKLFQKVKARLVTPANVPNIPTPGRGGPPLR